MLQKLLISWKKCAFRNPQLSGPILLSALWLEFTIKYNVTAATLEQQQQPEREYLRGIWNRLGIGHDGYLDRQELAQVCECIGMEKLADEVKYFLLLLQDRI